LVDEATSGNGVLDTFEMRLSSDMFILKLSKIFTLWFIDGLPIVNGGSFHGYVE